MALASRRLVVWMKLKDPELLRRLMAAKRPPVTHRALAEQIGKRHGTIGHLLAGRRTTVTPETALALAEALGVPVDVLFETNVVVTDTVAPSVSSKARQSKVTAGRAA